MNRSITSTEIKTVIKKLPTGQDGFTGELFQIFSEELTPPSETILKNYREGTLPDSFYDATITLIPKPDKDTTQKRKLQAIFTDEHRCKKPQQNTRKLNPAIY